MNENVKTLIFVGLAAVATLGGFATARIARNTAPVAKTDMELMLFPDFQEPSAAARLRITDFDESTGTLRSFEVANEKGVWSIPSHEDYPADAQKQMEQAAANLIDLKELSTVTTNRGEHALYGVVEPDDKLEPGASGVGKLVALEDKDRNPLCQLVIGKQEPDQPDIRYVRIAGKDSVYRVKIDVAKLSTKFEDWIEKDLLKIDTFDMRQINIDHYKEAIAQGAIRIGAGEKLLLTYDDKAAKWALDDLADGEELDTEKVNDLKNSLDQLKIVNVHRKPAGLGRDLRADDGLKVRDEQAFNSLMGRGFALFGDGTLIGTAGETQVSNTSGVRYILRFGGIDLESRGGQVGDGDDAEKEDGDEEIKPKTDANANRYLLVMAEFDPSFIPKPELKVKELPPIEELLKDLESKEKPAAEGEEESSTTEGDASPSAEAGEDESGQAPPAPEEDDRQEKTDAALPNGSGPDELAQAPEKKDPPAGDKPAKEKAADEPAAEEKKEGEESELLEDPAERAARKKAEAEKRKQEQDDDRKIDDYKQKLKKGKEKVKELNDRFADWYYVVSDSMYHKIELKRSDLLKAKPAETKPDEEKKPGEEDKPAEIKKPADNKPAAPPQKPATPATPGAKPAPPGAKPAVPPANPGQKPAVPPANPATKPNPPAKPPTTTPPKKP